MGRIWRLSGRTSVGAATAAIAALASLVACSSSESGQGNAGDGGGTDTGSEAGPSGGDSGGDSGPIADSTAAEASTDAGPVIDAASADVSAPACDGGVDAGDAPCLFTVAVEGGLSSFAYQNSGCVGLSNVGIVQWVGTTESGAQVNLEFRLADFASFTLGQPGTFRASLNVIEFEDGGASPEWDTPGNDCTLVIATDVCAPSLINPSRRLITGTGSCSQAAASIGLPASPPVFLGPFTFATTVN
jgi:hypothetical protein